MLRYGLWNEHLFKHIMSSLVLFMALNSLLIMAGEGVVVALGTEVDRLESEIQKIVPGIRHVDIEAHNPEILAAK